MALTLDDIRHLFDKHGSIAYSGEPVTQLQHALQSAALAEAAGASPELIVAALLHDLGHLLNLQGETPSERGIDDLHQYYALPFLRPLFSDAVLEPIRLHVDAKRCLCAIDATYHARLSADFIAANAPSRSTCRTGDGSSSASAQPSAYPNPFPATWFASRGLPAKASTRWGQPSMHSPCTPSSPWTM